MIQRNKTIDSKEYQDLTHKQKNILHAASGGDKSNTEIGREVSASLSYVAEVLNNYDHMLPLSQEPESIEDGEEDYNELTTTQQYILDLRSDGLESNNLISNQVGCSESYVYKTINTYSNLIPTPGYKSEDTSDNFVADGGQTEETNSSVTVTIQCDCGVTHEIYID